ncbi:CPBP family intramembrane glutamic endopeptidase [Bacillus sp. B15-48]|uniref:CPBP family intramembrane glutamic endopeptidase n=1 Tax=Bacillus sp. B15-48 TaxID=1548601 RepID=UPI00193FD474|nr:CPBP family intramembrane glutamic endopeptidase [Bacillus sp. B15-48]
MNKRFVFTLIIMLIASIVPKVILNETLGYVPVWLSFVQLFLLIIGCLFCFFVEGFKPFLKFAIILVTIILGELIIKSISKTSIWITLFEGESFIDHFGSSILLKLIMVIPVIFVLLLLLKSSKASYLTKGELSIKASKIGFLGIEDNRISWGKLSIISGFLIALGTLLLTLFTVTGLSVPSGIDQLVVFFPVIILLALANSFCEGVIYRSAILGTLKEALPKNSVILIAAVFFGIAHYYGAPSGIVGVFMSGVLGWYLCRSMYETTGFAAAWFIHFLQDVVIFSTIYLLFGYAN